MVTPRLLRLIAVIVIAVAAVHGQDLEKRITQLEEQMKLIDPNFETGSTATIARLDALEKKMAELLAARQPKNQVEPAALTPVSVAGTYEASADKETRLPVSGYMDFHVN